MRLLVLLLAGMATAPLRAVEIAPVRVAAPVDAHVSGAAMAGVQATRLANPGLTSLTPTAITSQLSVPTLAPSVISAAPAAAYAAPAEGSVLKPAVAASLSQQANPQQKAAPMAAVQGFVAQMESSRASGQDQSAEISQRFFDQSLTRGPPLAAPADASDIAAPKLPQGVKAVTVDTIRTEADVDRILPRAEDSHNPFVKEYLEDLHRDLKAQIPQMAPYQIYSYKDAKGGRFTGIDLAANPAIVDLIPDMRPHEIRLIRKLMLVNSDIRVLIREDGKTPDLVIGDKLVEMKSFSGQSLPLEALIEKANTQILLHGRTHGLGHGLAAIDMTREDRVPVGRVQGILNSWQAGVQGGVVLDQVIVFSHNDMQVFTRQANGSYQAGGTPVIAASRVVNERPLAPAEVGQARAMLRQGVEKSPVLALSL